MGKLTGRLVFPSSRNLLSVIVEHPTNVWARSFTSPQFIFKKSIAASHISKPVVVERVNPCIRLLHELSSMYGCGEMDSNHRPLAYEANELPLLYPAISISERIVFTNQALNNHLYVSSKIAVRALLTFYKYYTIFLKESQNFFIKI